MIGQGHSRTHHAPVRQPSLAAVGHRQLLGLALAGLATHVSLAWLQMFRREPGGDQPSTDRETSDSDRDAHHTHEPDAATDDNKHDGLTPDGCVLKPADAAI
jgi:hypothetical protein